MILDTLTWSNRCTLISYLPSSSGNTIEFCRKPQYLWGFSKITLLASVHILKQSFTCTSKRDEILFSLFRSDEDRLRSPEVHHALMDLFVFYLVQLPHVPESLRIILRCSQDEISQAYDKEPFKVSSFSTQHQM